MPTLSLSFHSFNKLNSPDNEVACSLGHNSNYTVFIKLPSYFIGSQFISMRHNSSLRWSGFIMREHRVKYPTNLVRKCPYKPRYYHRKFIPRNTTQEKKSKKKKQKNNPFFFFFEHHPHKHIIIKAIIFQVRHKLVAKLA